MRLGVPRCGAAQRQRREQRVIHHSLFIVITAIASSLLFR